MQVELNFVDMCLTGSAEVFERFDCTFRRCHVNSHAGCQSVNRSRHWGCCWVSSPPLFLRLQMAVGTNEIGYLAAQMKLVIFFSFLDVITLCWKWFQGFSVIISPPIFTHPSYQLKKRFLMSLHLLKIIVPGVEAIKWYVTLWLAKDAMFMPPQEANS